MNNTFRKWWCRLVLVCMMAVMVPFQSFAATGRIAFSDPSGQVGDEISVTMKFSSTDGTALGNTDVMLSYDAAMLEFINETDNASGGAGAIRVWTGPEGKTEMTTTLRFHALQAGTANLTISSWEAYDNDGAALTSVQEGSSKITIAALETSSNDARLQSLLVAPGALEPAFSPDTDQYSVSVGLDVSKLTVSAKANNDNATVSVEGGTDLQPGANTVVCKVTAEDGTTVKNYTITVNQVEGGATVDQNESAGEDTTETAEPEILAELDVSAKKIFIIDLPEGVQVPDYLEERTISISDVKVTGWISTLDEEGTYCVLYGMNESGEQGFYRYDMTERTVQRYFAEEASGELSQQKYDEVVAKHDEVVEAYNRMRFVTIGLGVLCVILLILLAVTARRKRAGGETGFMESEDRQEPKKEKHSAHAHGKKLSKEERYMMGEEDEYEEEEPEDDFEELAEDYLPERVSEPEEPDDLTAEEPDDPDTLAEPLDDMERRMEQDLAQEAAAAARAPEPDDSKDDDFEFFDLDE